MDGPVSPGGGDCFIWVDHGGVVAAVWIRPGGYFWCQSWPEADLAARAVDAAAAWGVTPESPPSWTGPMGDLIGPLTWLRAVLPLASRGEHHEYSFSSEWTEVGRDQGAMAHDLVRRLVASDLSTPGFLTTLSWPSLEVETFLAEPNPTMAAEVAERLRRDQEHRQHEADRYRAEVQRRRELDGESSAKDSRESDRAAMAAKYGRATLSEGEFVAAIVDGSSQSHLYEWADSLQTAVEGSAGPRASVDFSALGSLLRTAMRLRRADVSPFDGYLEAPPSIIKLYQTHGPAMRELIDRRDEAFRPLLHEIASTCYRMLGEPVSWAELIEHGASPVRPDVPEDEW